jgi:hypothetical protein
MRFPFVSRGRYDELKQRLDASEAERAKLLEALLLKPEEKREEKKETSRESTADYSDADPFSRAERRFYNAVKRGPIPDKFKVRLHG